MARNAHFSKLAKSAQKDVDKFLQRPFTTASLKEYLVGSWELPPFLDAKTPAEANEALAVLIPNARLEFPGLSDEQLDGILRLRGITEEMTNIAVARRCGFDDVPDFLNWIDTLSRLSHARIFHQPYRDGLLLLGDTEGLRRMFRRLPCEGHLAVIDYSWIFPEAIRAMVQGDENRLATCVRLMPKVDSRSLRPWLATLFATVTAVHAGNAAEVASQLGLHMQAMLNLKQKGELANTLMWAAHTTCRAIEAFRPELLAEFDLNQPWPWDAAVHAAVTARRQSPGDPLAACDLSGLPPLLTQLILNRSVPDWLDYSTAQFEIALVRGDPASKELLNEIETMAGGNGKQRAAKLLLTHASEARPLPLRWGPGPQMKTYFDAAAIRMTGQGARVIVGEHAAQAFPYLIAPDQTWID
jgi:hypothetical protein